MYEISAAVHFTADIVISAVQREYKTTTQG
jgi:hypothetical protein